MRASVAQGLLLWQRSTIECCPDWTGGKARRQRTGNAVQNWRHNGNKGSAVIATPLRFPSGLRGKGQSPGQWRGRGGAPPVPTKKRAVPQGTAQGRPPGGGLAHKSMGDGGAAQRIPCSQIPCSSSSSTAACRSRCTSGCIPPRLGGPRTSGWRFLVSAPPPPRIPPVRCCPLRQDWWPGHYGWCHHFLQTRWCRYH